MCNGIRIAMSDRGQPGANDGLGVFPWGSDLAALMLVLKLKGAYLLHFPPHGALKTELNRQALPNQERENVGGWTGVWTIQKVGYYCSVCPLLQTNDSHSGDAMHRFTICDGT